jgi:hypothetical protein
MKKTMLVVTMLLAGASLAGAETTWKALVTPGSANAVEGELRLTDDGRMILTAPGRFAGISSHARAAAGVRGRGDYAYQTSLVWLFRTGTTDAKGIDRNVRVLRDEEAIEVPKKAVSEFIKAGPAQAVFIITPPAGGDFLLSFCIAGPECLAK